jgi:pyruvate formate lyase activating enzyme
VKFSGLQKTSLIDYPNKVASVLYVPGCNLRCPFCHNWRIVVDPKPPFLQTNTALKILENRKKYIDAVVITGGEPTLYKDLPIFLGRLKEKGFQVKLDTNGFFPEKLQECLPFIDYVAMDVKTTPKKYSLLGAKETSGLIQTIDMLKRGKTAYEFRITVVPGIVIQEDAPQMGHLLSGARKLVLQQFIPNDTLDKKYKKIKPYSIKEIKNFEKAIKKYVKETLLRL